MSVGSKQFAANRLLGWMTFEVLVDRGGIDPTHRLGLGRTNRNWQSLVDGDVNCYWDYTGTVWRVLLDQDERIADADRLYDRVAETLADRGLQAVSRAPYDNSYVLIANPVWADRRGVEGLSTFADRVSAAPRDVEILMEQSFAERNDGWRALLDHYGVDAETQSILQEQTTYTDSLLGYRSVAAGEYDIGLGFATNPNFRHYDVVELADDRGFFPPYNPVLLFSSAGIESPDRITSLLEPIGPSLDGVDRMRQLTDRVVFDRESPRRVARTYLQEVGLV